MTPEQRVRATYDAFNGRDERTAVAGLDPQVQWDDGSGHMLRGRQSVADHWREQWQKMDASIRIDSMHWHGDELVVQAMLDGKRADGSGISQPVRNTVRFSNDLIASMRIG